MLTDSVPIISYAVSYLHCCNLHHMISNQPSDLFWPIQSVLFRNNPDSRHEPCLQIRSLTYSANKYWQNSDLTDVSGFHRHVFDDHIITHQKSPKQSMLHNLDWAVLGVMILIFTDLSNFVATKWQDNGKIYILCPNISYCHFILLQFSIVGQWWQNQCFMANIGLINRVYEKITRKLCRWIDKLYKSIRLTPKLTHCVHQLQWTWQAIWHYHAKSQ